MDSDSVLNSDPESIRRAHLSQESNVKSVGQLSYLVAFFSALVSIVYFLIARGVLDESAELRQWVDPAFTRILYWFLAVLFGSIALGHVAIGHGLIHLRAWARWTVVVITGLSLMANTMTSLVLCLGGTSLQQLDPLIGLKINGVAFGLTSLVIGGAIHLLILYPFLTSGASVVFSRAYREIIGRNASDP